MYSTSRSIMRIRKDVSRSPASDETCIQTSYISKPAVLLQRKRRPTEDELYEEPRKFTRPPSFKKCSGTGFEALPEDLVIAILGALISKASSPADLASTMLTCRRFCAAANHPQVLVHASPGALAVKASSWSDGAHRFLKSCADAGNVEACYTLGMATRPSVGVQYRTVMSKGSIHFDIDRDLFIFLTALLVLPGGCAGVTSGVSTQAP